MSSDVVLRMEVKGLAELKKKLAGLPAELVQKMDREAMKKGLQPAHDNIVQNAPVGETAELAESIQEPTSKKVIGPSGETYMYGVVAVTAPHAHLVEYGHEQCDHQGNPTGVRVPPNPFMWRALEKTYPEVTQKIADEVGQGLERCEVLHD